MAGRAFGDLAVMALNRRCGQIVIGLCSRPFSMRAAVAGFTCHAAVSHAVPIQCVVLLGKALVGGNDWGGRIRAVGIGAAPNDLGAQMSDSITRVTGLALGQVGPGLTGCLTHRGHVPVTVRTNQTRCRHGASVTFCSLARMAIVTGDSTGRQGFYLRGMIPVNGLRHGLIRHLSC